jgi:hypothetical protein
MGCGLKPAERAISPNWSKQNGATGASSAGFAPVRQLRQFLIGKKRVTHLAQRLSRACASIRTDSLCRLRLGGYRADHRPYCARCLNRACVVIDGERRVPIRAMSNTKRAVIEQKPRKERPIPRRLGD